MKTFRSLRPLAAIAVLLSFCLPAAAAPFAEWLQVPVPGGGTVRIWGEGDEYDAWFETEDGHALRMNGTAGRYEYVTRDETTKAYVGTGVFLGDEAGNEALLASIPLHLRDESAEHAAAVEARVEAFESVLRTKENWETLRAQTERNAEIYEKIAKGEWDGPQPTSVTRGTVVGVTLLVDFPVTNASGQVVSTLLRDRSPRITRQVVDDWFNREEPFGEHGYSVRKFFGISSGGQLDYTNVVIGPILVSHPRAYYDDPKKDCGVCGQLLVGDALAALAADPDYQSKYLPLIRTSSVNYAGNGKALNVVFAGDTAANWDFGLWAHRWVLSSAQYNSCKWTNDSGTSCNFYNYNIVPANNYPDSPSTTLHHENGHMVCGFPDLYHYSGKTYGVGNLSLMSYHGASDIDPYLRAGAGWYTPKTLPSSGWVTVTSDRTDVWKFQNPSRSSEYFLVENRQNGQMNSLGGSGIVVWRCCQGRSNETATRLSQYNAGHAATNRYDNELSVEQADGLYEFERRYSSTAGANDFWFEGNTAARFTGTFDNDSAACSRWYDGTASGLKLSHFSKSGPTMRVLVGDPAQSPDPVAWISFTGRTETSVSFSTTVEGFGAGASSVSVVAEFGSDEGFTSVLSTRTLGTVSTLNQARTWTVDGLDRGTEWFVRLKLVNATGQQLSDVVGLFEPFAPVPLYVKPGGAGAKDGSSWENAFANPGDALDVMAADNRLFAGVKHEAWVAEGVYSPDQSRPVKFWVSGKDFALYGGFAGNETSREQRDWIAHPTVLSGEAGDPDDPTDNLGTLVAGQTTSDDTVHSLWDGFVVRDTFTGPAVVGSTSYLSGDYFCTEAITFDHCLFTGNVSTGVTAAVSAGPVMMRNSVVEGNSSSFVATTSWGSPGRICSITWFRNCTIAGNESATKTLFRCRLDNSIVWDNEQGSQTIEWYGNEMDNTYADRWLFQGYGSDRYIIQGPLPTRKIGSNWTVDPVFAPDGDHPEFLRALGSSSPAIDKGAAGDWMDSSTLDYLGNPRVSGDAPDLGAVEYVQQPTKPVVTLVSLGDATASSVPVLWSLDDIGHSVATAALYAQYSTSADFSGATSVPVVSAATGPDSGTFLLSGLASGTTYHVRLRAVNGAQLEAFSSALSFTTADSSLPDFTFSVAPSETVTRGVVTLSVASFGTGASSGTATVEYSTSADFAGAKTATAAVSATGATSVELSRLSADTLYYVRVTLVNDKGRSLARSAQSFRTGDPGFYAPGLLQVRYKYSPNAKTYPDFTVTVANNSSTYAIERAPGPFMADIYGSSAGVKTTNPYTGTEWDWQNYTVYYYEGEMFFKGGVAYDFFHCVDDGVAIELDGQWLTRQSASNKSGYDEGVTQASKTFETDGWHPIRIWVYEWEGGKGYVKAKIGFEGIGLGWNTNGCTSVNAASQARWSTLRDPGDASLLRVLVADALPSFVTLEDDLAVSGTTLTGTVRTDGIEDGCTVTLYAGRTNAGSNTVGWAQSKVLGTVPSEEYALPFSWADFCAAGDSAGWFVIARMTNASGSYEGWSLVRQPAGQSAPALGAVGVATTKTAATLTVPVTSLGAGGASVTVSATLGGATKTATLSAPGEATFVFDGLAAETEYAWSVSAVAAPTGLAATPQSGVATTQGVQKETKGWFFVDLSDAGYAAFPDVSGVAAPGGTWSGAGEYSATYSAAGRTLSIARAENAAADAELRYTPTKPTESGCDAEVRGTIRPNAVSILPAPPSGPLGGVVFLRRGGRAVPHGLADGAWHELSPSVAEGADVAWEAIFDFSSASKPRVRYAIGATTNAWIALASGTKLSAVAFRGSGTLGSFRGAYARVVGSFAKPEFGAASADGSALGIGTDPATGRATFSVTIDNATDDADYAVYVCDTVDGDYVLDAAATQSGTGEFRTFTMVDDAATKFVKIVAAEPGYAFPRRFADIAF